MSSTLLKSALLQVSFDYAALRAPGHCPLGCYVVPSLDSPMDWEGVLFVHKGLYAGLVVRFHLVFPPSYPAQAPTLAISTPAPSAAPPFHPSISPEDGSIRLLPPTVDELRSGRPPADQRNRAWRLLFAFRDLFKLQALERLTEADVKDHEAFRTFKTQPERFRSLVAQSVALSNSPSTLYARGSKVESEIFQFRPLAPAEEARVKAKLLGGATGRRSLNLVGGALRRTARAPAAALLTVDGSW